MSKRGKKKTQINLMFLRIFQYFKSDFYRLTPIIYYTTQCDKRVK